VQSQSFPNFVHSSPKQRSTESIHQLQEQKDAPVAPDPVAHDLGEIVHSPPARLRNHTPTNARSSGSAATPRAKGEERWRALESGILSVPVNQATPASSTSESQRKKRKSEAPQDGGAQTKLAAFGFFATPTQGRVTRSAAKNFEKEWEEEENLDFDQVGEYGEDVQDIKEESAAGGSKIGPLSGRKHTTPRTRTNQRLGKVPDAPYHPSLRPAGIAELKKREKAQASPSSSSRTTDNSARHSPSTRASPNAKVAYPAEMEDASVPRLRRQDKPQPSSSDLTSLSSSSEGELFPGFSGKGGTAEEWFERIGDRRSSEFGSFPSI
jgi:hypothetical protein